MGEGKVAVQAARGPLNGLGDECHEVNILANTSVALGMDSISLALDISL